MNLEDVKKVLTDLAIRKKIFHSEAELQFELGVEFKKNLGNVEIWFEYPASLLKNHSELLGNDKNRSPMIDLVIIENGDFYPIEIKYAKGKLEYKDENENEYILSDNGKDKSFFYVYDIRRLELFASKYSRFKKGYAIIISNNEDWYRSQAPKKRDKFTFDFYLINNSDNELKGEIWYQLQTDEKKHVILKDKYKTEWAEYSSLEPKSKNSEFKYLICEIKQKNTLV